MATLHTRERQEEADRIRRALGGLSLWEIEQHAAAIRAAVAGARATERVRPLRDQAQRAVELLDAVLVDDNPALL